VTPVKAPSALRDRDLIVVVAAAAASAVLSLSLTPHGAPLPPDAIEYASVAKNVARGRGFTIDFVEFHPGLLSSIRHPMELHGVLTALLLAPLFRVWGAAPAFVRIPGIVECAALVVAVFVLARAVFGRRAGFLAASLFLLRGDFIGDALLGGDDVGWALFSTLAVHYFLRGLRGPDARLLWAAGGFAGWATLQKYTGILLPLVFAPIVVASRTSRRSMLRDLTAVASPVALAASVYAWKNHVTYGKWGFRFTALDWLSREGLSAYFAYYETTPKLADVWERMGALRVLDLCAVQLAALLRLAADNWRTTFGGIVALIWMIRQKPAFAGVALLYSGGLAAVVCVLYHVEPRYLFALVPLFYVAMAGAAVQLLDRVAARLPHYAVPYAGAAAALALAALFVRATTELVLTERKLDEIATGKGACDDAFGFIKSSVSLDDPVVSSSPWYVTWATERPSVAAPTNGAQALAKVTDYYGARWAITGLPTFGGADVEADLAALPSAQGGFRATLAFDGAACDVYRLDR
jgi:hypothetical protein